MAKFKLPVVWEVYGTIEVEAETIEDAVAYFDENSDFIPLPKETHYIDGSFDLSSREVDYLELFQK